MNSILSLSRLSALFTLTLSLLCVLAPAGSVRAEDKPAGAAGTWSWTSPGRDGQTRTTTLKLKVDGEKLTGTISGRNADTEISDGKLKGDQVTFSVVREFNGNKMTMKYAGKLSGDSIKGKTEFERNGEAQSRDWEAKRSDGKEKAKE